MVCAQPQLRIVAVTARAGRAMLGAILGRAGAGEQTLLKRRPELFALSRFGGQAGTQAPDSTPRYVTAGQ